MRQTTAEAFKKRYGGPIVNQEPPWLLNKSDMFNKDLKRVSAPVYAPPRETLSAQSEVTHRKLTYQTGYLRGDDSIDRELIKKAKHMISRAADYRQMPQWKWHSFQITIVISLIVLLTNFGTWSYFKGEKRMLYFSLIASYKLKDMLHMQTNHQLKESPQLNFLLVVLSIGLHTYSFLQLNTLLSPSLNTLQKYGLSAYLVAQAIYVSFFDHNRRPPKLSKLHSLRASKIRILSYTLVKQFSRRRIIKSSFQILLRVILIIATSYIFFHWNDSHEPVLPFIKPLYTIIFIHYFLYEQTIKLSLSKLTKYSIIDDLYSNSMQMPLYLFPLIANDSQLEIESFKFIQGQIEQPLKLCFDDKTQRRSLQNGQVFDTKSILSTFLIDRFDKEADTLVDLVNDQNQLRRSLQRDGIFDRLRIRYKLRQTKSKIIERESFLIFYSEVFYRVLNSNSCQLSQAELQTQIDSALKKYSLLNQSLQNMVKTKRMLKLFNVLNFQASILSKQINNEQKYLDFRSKCLAK